jgi:capsular exopolysaccharide synthesis family protein
VRDSWRSILAITLLAGLTGGYLAWREPARYTTAVTMVVSSLDIPDDTLTPYQRTLLIQQQAKSFAVLLRSERVLRAVIEDLRLDTTPSALAGEVTTSAASDGTLITATVGGTAARPTQAVANSLAAQFIRLVPELVTPATGKPPAVTVSIVNPAALPGPPTNKQPLRDVVGAVLLGLFCGVALAFARQHLDNRVRRGDELTTLAGAPLLGSVVADPAARQTPLVIHDGAYGPRAEGFRKVRATLKFAAADRPHQVLLVASPVSGDGRTMTACNLAITIAQSGKRVLLIDADLRRPRVAGYLGLHSGVGLTTVLAGGAEVEGAIQSWGDNLISVLPSGPIVANPGEMLASRRLRALLEELRGEYDLVLIDAPPVLPVADAATVAAACDGVIVLVRQGRTTRDQVEGTVSTLRSAGAYVLGTVLNRVPLRGEHAQYREYGAQVPGDAWHKPSGGSRRAPVGQRHGRTETRVRS